ncbi:MAG TPA: hypothetical protein ENH29_09085, partial [Bacteroidetes bacterium]|nr:hypothetical protein [Bacteroidota bacterium]
MAYFQRNQILYMGRDREYANSVAKILNYHENEFELDTIQDVREIEEAVGAKKFEAYILDANLFQNGDKSEIDRILHVADDAPVLMLIDEGQEQLGRYALEKGAFDYIVRVPGALTSIPATIDCALELKSEQENIPIDFRIESDLNEITSFFEINETGRFLKYDENLSEILGLQNNEFYKSYLMDYISDEDRDKFYRWRASSKIKEKNLLLQTEVIHRTKGIIPVELQLQPFSRPESLLSGFRGYLKIISGKTEDHKREEAAALVPLFKEIFDLTYYLNKGFNQLFSLQLTEIPKKYFHFDFAGLYLYSHLKDEYICELRLGEPVNVREVDLQSNEFDTDDIARLFPGKDFIRFVHQSVLTAEERSKIHGSAHDELFLEKSWNPGEDWQLGDRLFINLKNAEDTSHGFIILERPASGKIPGKAVLRQIEIYAIFISSLYGIFTRTENVEAKYKQLKQAFVILETFSVDESIEGLLKEITWTIKFSLKFNLCAISFLSKATRRLHIRAAAVEGKEKASILTKLHYKLSEIKPLLKDECKISNSYLISLDKTSPFQLLKRIYGLPLESTKASGRWRQNNLLLV